MQVVAGVRASIHFIRRGSNRRPGGWLPQSGRLMIIEQERPQNAA
ncbi:MAG: hypothetical protein AVDCRST_MAG31-53 [uncultured Sphingomonas sp.]|uniref:Uncharacterized protein n=1 Tax=uncultured Sphingomonas sp. TaxID=158754 RepID=A0A6J4SBU3_9SPHN|nr:MAG: hypothetical protein AVDCRST_MAG31-53 [uncultured Sphingomonas sp.]